MWARKSRSARGSPAQLRLGSPEELGDEEVQDSLESTSKLRAVLYFGARSAIRYNKACMDLYQRLRARGKSHYKAMIAVMAKLLKQVFAVVKSGVPFDNDYYLKFQQEN